ncbi:MAG: topoisomerase, partial [Rhodobacteraceae bacterium]|nr:topoisomerase [Paracoccaceae bacterium]
MASLGKTIYVSKLPAQTHSPKIDYSEINARLLPMLPNLLAEWLPAGRKEGCEYVCGDLQGNPGVSLKVNLDTGKWSDFATDDKGGDIVSLYAALKGLRQSDAAKELGERHGLLDLPVKHPKPRIVKNKPSFNHPKHGKPSQDWTYPDAAGDVLHYIARYDQADGKKQFIPIRPDGTMKYIEGLRPLYGLDRLAARPSAPVIICEGEKAADAAQHLCPDAVVITWSGGSNATGKAEWTPLQGREVIVWPDADDPGFK